MGPSSNIKSGPSAPDDGGRRMARRTERRKHRGLTCANCRARKVRCEGSQPACKTCEAFGDQCRYEKAPPMSQILDMARRLQEAEETIARLRAAGEEPGTPSSASHAFESAPSPRSTLGPGRGVAEIPTALPKATDIARLPPAPAGSDRVRSTSIDSTNKDMPQDLSVDVDGTLCYYGPTSAVHDPPTLRQHSSPQASANPDALSKSHARSVLAAKARESRTWEEFAIGNAGVQSDIPRQVIARLLEVHWTWIAPMFMWIYRPAFMDDMSTGGRYFSEFLLIVVCGHAASFYDRDIAERLISKARMLLGSAIHQPGAIPTVQALLQLSARDLASGSISHAWLYSGMAFRIARDLGLHHSSSSIPTLTPIDAEVRRRLFWSCYWWDKAMSLYTGRLPAFAELPDEIGFEFFDDSTENELWSPFIAESFKMSRLPQEEYPPMKGHLVSCFANSCKISVIINDIIFQLYSRQTPADLNTNLYRILARLDDWRIQSPTHLRYDADHLPEICPPPHILSQNLLYYTVVIIARRPFWSMSTHYQACLEAASNIEKLLLLLEGTFGFENITYLMAYCIYTGASAILQDANRGNGEAIAKLQTFIRALQSGLKRCPVLQRSLNLIYKSMTPLATSSGSFGDFGEDVGEASGSIPYMPAFPYFGLNGDYGVDSMFTGFTNDPLSALDCFPESHLDMGGMSQ